jgi:hypothetical protein
MNGSNAIKPSQSIKNERSLNSDQAKNTVVEGQEAVSLLNFVGGGLSLLVFASGPTLAISGPTLGRQPIWWPEGYVGIER